MNKTSEIVAWFLGFVFFISGTIKIQSFQAFAENVNSFSILPQILITTAAFTLPIIEVLLGVCMVIHSTRKRSAFFSAILCFVFFTALLQAEVRGLDVDCGCFGQKDPFSAYPILGMLRASILFAFSIFIYSKTKTN